MKIVCLFMTVMVSLVVAKDVQAADAPKGDRLIAALIQVESRGDDNAIGDKGKKEMAYGCLQVRKPCIDDVNKHCGTKYQAKDCLGNRALSVWVCTNYLRIYGTQDRLGRSPTNQDLARIWNGGPNGWKFKSTNVYWSKVQKQLK
jgi:hypothetical protein